MKKILGISAFYHDSAAVLVCDGKLVAAAQEERFTRIKHDASFPSHAITYCLAEAGISPDHLDAIVFYDKPLLKFERLLETYYAYAPKGLRSFLSAMPVWAKEKLFFKQLLKKNLSEIDAFHKTKTRLLFTEHHQAHAASAFLVSPFNEAAILTIDGVGEWATASIGRGMGNKIEIIKQLEYPHSLGLLYSAFTFFLGFRVNSGEYKLMGLAPYGNRESPRVAHFRQIILEQLIKIFPDGSIWLNQKYFSYSTGMRMIDARKWEKLFGLERRMPESPIDQPHADLALAIQQVTEEVLLKMAAHTKSLTGLPNLCLAGGVALNCVANRKLLNSNLFDDIFIQPAAGDAGGALGAALAAYYLLTDERRQPESSPAFNPYLGPAFTRGEISEAIHAAGLAGKSYDDPSSLCDLVARFISNGKIIGWFQERMEWGPRALGNRSILGDPRNPTMQEKINLKIKNRESFRPFAPAVAVEFVSKYFDQEQPSPYMLMTAPVKSSIRHALPHNYQKLPWQDKLAVNRSSLPAITHVDFSARLQTVSADFNPLFHQLIMSFHALTGCAALINTSFNVRGEPMVCSPSDAIHCFQNTDMDVLVLGNVVIEKSRNEQMN